MSADERPAKLSLVIQSGHFDQVHYALVMASAALATNIPVTLFFTNWACRALAAPQADHLPGWALMPVSQGRLTAPEHDRSLTAKGLAGFEELLEAVAALGGTVMVCEMGLRAMGLTAEDLRPDIPLSVTGMVTFLHQAGKDGQIIWV